MCVCVCRSFSAQKNLVFSWRETRQARESIVEKKFVVFLLLECVFVH